MCFRPHIWGCPFRTNHDSLYVLAVMFPSPYLRMSLPDTPADMTFAQVEMFPSPYLGMSLPDKMKQPTSKMLWLVSVPIPGDVPSGLTMRKDELKTRSFRPHTWGCPFRTVLHKAIRDRIVSVPIPGDVPSGLKKCNKNSR